MIRSEEEVLRGCFERKRKALKGIVRYKGVGGVSQRRAYKAGAGREWMSEGSQQKTL